MARFVVLFVLVLYVDALLAASSQNINRQCANQARWAADIFDMVTENPRVYLNGVDALDEEAFAFIRKWVSNGRTRGELIEYTIARCTGTEV